MGDEGRCEVGVEVSKRDLCIRPADAPPARLDNEPDDVHSDGLQVYLSEEWGLGNGGGAGYEGYLIAPEKGNQLRVRTVSDASADPAAVRGACRRTDHGHRVTLTLSWPEGIL